MVWSFLLARGAVRPGRAGNHTPGLTERGGQGGRKVVEEQDKWGRAPRSSPAPIPCSWSHITSDIGCCVRPGMEDTKTRPGQQVRGYERQQTRGKKNLTSARSRCILWVERRQSSTIGPPGVIAPRRAFFLCKFARALETSFTSSTGPGSRGPRQCPITRLLSQPGYTCQPVMGSRRIQHCGRRRSPPEVVGEEPLILTLVSGDSRSRPETQKIPARQRP